MEHEPKACDLLKITLQSDDTYTGYELQEALRNEGIYAELADPRNVLLVLPLLKEDDTFPTERIVQAIQQAITAVKKQKRRTIIPPVMVDDTEITELALTFQQMQLKKKEYVSLTEAINRIAAEPIIPYPPGVPFIIEGEQLTKKKLDYLCSMLTLGVKFHGGSQLKEANKILIYR